MKHKGSISCKYLHFATLIQLAIIFPFPQSVLTSAKKARLGELVGEVKEDEPGGEAMVGPSGEATTHSSCSTPIFLPFFWILQRNIYLKLLFFFNPSFTSLLFSFLTDDLAEEAPKLSTKEERDIDTLWTWVQVEGFPAWPKEEAWGAVDRGKFILPSFLVASSDFCSAIPLFPFLTFLL